MIIVLLASFGLVFGSFVNAFVWRLRQQELAGEKSKASLKKAKKQYSVLTGRSMCPSCHHELAAKDLVPVVSWLWLRGKCRYCSTPISWQYPLVELTTAVLFVLSYVFWPLALSGVVSIVHFVVWLGFLTMFMALAVYDLKWFLLPDRIVFPLMVVALLDAALLAGDTQTWASVWQPLAGAVLLSGLFFTLFQVSSGTWIGGGDVKLAVVLGLLAGTPLKAVLVLFFASIIGTFVSLPLLFKAKKSLRGSMKVRVPFGPFLLAATLVVVLFGSSIISWYTERLLGY